nr:GNAT family N-acetyltransferase [Candidatus Sigynarchaeota archaeon]
MAVHGVLDGFALEHFSRENIKNVHTFFETHAGLYSFDIDTFIRASIGDEDFDPGASVVVMDQGTGTIIAAALAIIRKARVNFKKRDFSYVFTTLNMFCVHGNYRRKGIGSAMLAILLERLKAKGR